MTLEDNVRARLENHGYLFEMKVAEGRATQSPALATAYISCQPTRGIHAIC